MRTKHFLALLLLVVFLCVPLRQSSHVHHQHGSEDAERAFGSHVLVLRLLDGNYNDAKSHGEHSHDLPDKTAHLYKYQTGWKTFRGKADDDSKLKMPAAICARDTAILTPEVSTIHAPYVMGVSKVWIDGCTPARAPPVI